MTQNKVLAARYDNTQAQRSDRQATDLRLLQENGYLAKTTDNSIEVLLSALVLISRFWISEAAVSCRDLSPEEQKDHYLRLIAQLLLPYATEKGRMEIHAFLLEMGNHPSEAGV